MILGCDSLVRPGCHSEAFQQTRAGFSDKPVLLNNTTKRRAENIPCCVNQLIGRTHQGMGAQRTSRADKDGTTVTDPALNSKLVSPSTSKDNGAPSSLSCKLVCHRPDLPSWFNRCSRYRSTLPAPPRPHGLVTQHNTGTSQPELLVCVGPCIVCVMAEQ